MWTDIAIIGAGPAGCAAALRARQAGLRVVILDANARPKSAPGETLHPGIEPLLTQLGVFEQILQAGFHRHRGVWISCGNKREFVPYGGDANGPWFGIQAERRIFHHILQQATLDAQATLLRNTRPESLLIDENRVKGVVVNGSELHAAWTVDATGHRAWLAQELKLPVSYYSPPLGVRFGWCHGQSSDLNGQPAFVFRDDGWDWQAPLANNRTAWVELRIGESRDTPPPGVKVTWGFRPACAGPGFFLLGDAAVTLDPSSSHGVLRALMSGILCSHLLSGLFDKRASETSILEAYRIWMKEQFKHDERRLRQHYVNSPAGTRFSTGLLTPSSTSRGQA